MKISRWFLVMGVFAPAMWLAACATPPARSQLGERLPVVKREAEAKYPGLRGEIFLTHYRIGYEKAFASGKRPELGFVSYDLDVAQAGYLRGKYDAETDLGAPLDKKARGKWRARHIANPLERAMVEAMGGY